MSNAKLIKDLLKSITVLLVVNLTVLSSVAQVHTKNNSDTVTTSSIKNGVKLRDVEVVGSKKYGIESSQMSAIQITPLQIKRVPVFMGEPDVLKALQKFPGVSSESEGTVGISVRGGNFDQNLITLDGATLYNPEHLKGYASAINPDMVGGIDFYRGAFPARYGSRLSSVIDVNMKEGDFNKYHASLFLGMLSGSVSVGGPIWKDHTSFIVGGRMSYFDLMAYPILEKVYDDTEKLRSYSNMKYFDVNAKISHKFMADNKLTATFYYGRDRDDVAPSQSEYKQHTKELLDYYDTLHYPIDKFDKIDFIREFDTYSSRMDSTKTEWSNLCSALNWKWDINKSYSLGATMAYSKYDYSIIQNSYYDSRKVETNRYTIPLEERDPSFNEYLQIEDVNHDYFSKVENYSLEARLGVEPCSTHNILVGFKADLQRLTPKVRVKNHLSYKDYRYNEDAKIWYVYRKEVKADTIMGESQDVKQYTLYAEDDYTISKNVKLNLGLRASLYAVRGKDYFSLEPRFSFRWQFLKHNAVKMSYSRMAQSTHRLVTNNLKSSSELWVPITSEIPLMKSDLWALGYVYEPMPGLSASVEGYYKTMNDIVEYKQNANYSMAMRDWSQMVAVGDGRSYGVEILLEKYSGNTTGWLSYTWSKALRKFDEAGNQLNGGREFYASNDRRHNLNIVLTQKVNVRNNAFFEFTSSWTYQTGRRGTIPIAQIMGGRFAYFDGIARFPGSAGISTFYPYDETFYHPNKDKWHIYDAIRGAISTRDLNHYVLPAIHHLDLSVNFSVKHKLGESVIGLSVYNVYNRKNVNTAYVGFDKNKIVLKCHCPFPIMPSLSYTHKF